ncbi:MAG: DUF899 domain-containing protein [Acidimicrobiales bacterium]|nr:DUF899 domain-containing protein [Acidimicrobiales bacterium]RZV43424.1 MAG: DUF899 domain-containing protein [Acidimicrobiales bacterium]
MTTHTVVDPEAWRAARLTHLEEEKAFTRARDELSAKRRNLPWLEITADYTFDGPGGDLSLSDLFGDQPQLLMYHFMYGPDWDEGCPSCSFWADNYNGTLPHLAARNTTFITVSRAPLATLDAYKERMGWSFPWYSSHDSSFNFDMGVSATPEQIASGEPIYNFGTQAPFGDESAGLSAFRKEGDKVYLTYQTFSRGLDMLNGVYHHLDTTSMGRDEENLPWSMAWLRRHDQYDD